MGKETEDKMHTSDRVSLNPATGTIVKLKAEGEDVGDIITPRICADRLFMSTATLRTLCKKGVIPSISLPGSRLVRFSWRSVQEALRRAERSAA